MASTGAQLVSVSRKYRNGDATWDAAEVSDNIYEDDNAFALLSLKDFFILRLSEKEDKILRDYFNQ